MASMNEALERSITIPDESSFFFERPDESSKHELFRKIKEAQTQGVRIAQLQSSKPKIQRVHEMLRDHPYFEKYYEPRFLAIGPYHQGKARCDPAETLKLALAAKYVQDSGRPVEVLHKIIEDNINTLRVCYDEEVTNVYTGEALTDLLFLDGCSTLQFIYSFMNNQLADFNFKRDQAAFAEQDCFLLENQLPYLVLKLLMSSSDKEEALSDAIQDFVARNILRRQKSKHKTTRQPGSTFINMEEPTHLLDLLRTEMLGSQKPEAKKKKSRDRRGSFRNIQELKAAGIHVKPSKTSTLRDISFTSRGSVGSLNLPQIVIDDSMGLKFMNLIAFEMCPDFQNDFGVTSYIWFMKSLISDADDVKLLKSEGVLYNVLGTDQEVAYLLNQVSYDLVPNSNAYRSVKTDIEKHYESKWKPKLTTWTKQFSRDYFSSPWTILASLGVLFALGLTVTQTWYTINPPNNA